jgi:hypothetical protein
MQASTRLIPVCFAYISSVSLQLVAKHLLQHKFAWPHKLELLPFLQVGDLMQYVEAMQITRIPYFHFYKNNKRVAEFSANMRPDKLALLRAEIAAHKEQPVQQADTSSYQTLEA